MAQIIPQSGGVTNREKQAALTLAMAQMSPVELSQKIAQAALVPIVNTMIEESFSRRIFTTDRIDGASAMYTIKRRMRPLVIAKYGNTPITLFDYPRVTVVPYYIEVQPEIEMSDLMDAQFDAASDIMNDAGKEMAVKEDLEFIRLLATAAPDQGTVTTTTPPTTTVGPGGQGILFGVNQYRVGTGATAPLGGATGEPGLRDLILAQATLRQVGYKASTILINPYMLGLFMSQTSFVSVFNSGSREIMETGMLTSTLGSTFVFSPLVPAKTAYIIDSQDSGRFVERESLTVQPRQEGHRMKWLVYERVSPFIRNANSILAVTYYV